MSEEELKEHEDLEHDELADLFDDEEDEEEFNEQTPNTHHNQANNAEEENESDDELTEDSESTKEKALDSETPENKETNDLCAINQSIEKTPIEDIPIDIRLELGDLSASLQDLLDLQAGQVLELGHTLNDQVRLVVDGRCIGQAEVVKIGDKFGIRIIDLVKRQNCEE